MGGLNGLVNNAGILRDGLLVKKDRATGAITEAHEEQWHAVIGVNLTGATLMVRDVVAKMVDAGDKGVIVNMSSIARHGNRGQSNYSAAKAALATNTKTWSQEFAPFGIRVGAIAPGMIETPMTQGMNQKARDALVAMIPVGRDRRARGHLARREVRPRVRLLQRPHHRRRRRPRACRLWTRPIRRGLAVRGGHFVIDPS